MASFSQSTVFKTALTQPNVDAAIKESFIMGGICADKDETMPSMPCRLNRVSCATMNQLYHLKISARFFQFLVS
jgi:hypothetical protein